jgi:hypothetical protein
MEEEEKKEIKGTRTSKRKFPRKKKETKWREVRVIATKEPDEVDCKFSAIMAQKDEVGNQMFGLALLKGFGDNTQVVCIGDGAPWIADEFMNQFPKGWFLLDKYHLYKHLYEAGEALPKDNENLKQRWVMAQMTKIDLGLVDKVLKECEDRAGGNKDSPFYSLRNYIAERRNYLNYSRAIKEGLPLGSGIVESAHNYLVQDRLKLPGTWWKEENVNKMLALRVIQQNKWWNEYWTNYA